MPYTVIEGHQLHYELSGPPDAPPAVLVHGLMSSLRFWDNAMPTLETHYRCLRLDLLGHGESQKIPGPGLCIDRQAQLVLGLMDALGIPAAVLIGHSMGGQIALWIASHAPERVTRLVAITAVTDARLTDRANRNMQLVRLGVRYPRLGGWLTALFRSPRNPLRWAITESSYFSQRQPEAVFHAVYDEAFRRDNYPCKIQAYEAISGYRALDDAACIGAPTLIIGAQRDQVVPPEQSPALKAVLPQAELVMLDAGHMLTYDAAEALNTALQGFLVNQNSPASLTAAPY